MSRLFVNKDKNESRSVYAPRGEHPTLSQALKSLAGVKADDLNAVKQALATTQRALRAADEEHRAVSEGFVEMPRPPKPKGSGKRGRPAKK